MAWERFTETGKGYSPKASIWRGGQIGFSQGAVNRLNLNAYEWAVLYFDVLQRRIGIDFTNDSAQPGATKLLKRGKGAFVSAKAFLDYHGIQYPQDSRFDLERDEETGYTVISLNK